MRTVEAEGWDANGGSEVWVARERVAAWPEA